MTLLSLFLFGSSTSYALEDTTMAIVAAALVDMAKCDNAITPKEHALIKEKFPFRDGTDPVFVFSIDHTQLPQQLSQLPFAPKQEENIFHLLGLVALIDGSISEKEYAHFQLYQKHSSTPKIQNMNPNTFFEQSRHLYNRLQHEPMLQTMKEMVTAQKKYHKRFNKYFSAKRCPSPKSNPPLTWEMCKGLYHGFPWVIPNEIVGSYTIEGTRSAFVITGHIDIDGDGNMATYVSTHSSPNPKRVGNPKFD